MTFLIAKIFAYLAIALMAGVLAGWALRARLTQTVEPDSSEIIELHSKVERLEKALVSRDEELLSTQIELQSRGDSQQLEETLNARNFRITQLEEQVEKLQLNLANGAANDEADGLITALHSEIARLQEALRAKSDAQNGQNEESSLMVRELEARLVRKAGEMDRLEQALVREEKKVRELERERELQNKSLHVLHQQLELERERHPQQAHG